MKEKLSLLETRLNFKAIVLGAFIASVPFSRPLSIILLSTFALFWLVESSAKEKYYTISNRLAVILPGILFLIYSLSLLYSYNKDFFFLEKRLLLFFMPIIIGSTKLDKRQIIFILNCFIISCLLFTIWSFIEAYKFYNLPTEHFSWQHLPHQLAKNFHAPYLALFLVLSNFFVLFQSSKGNTLSGWQWFVLIYFSLYILILSSRTALISNTGMLLFYFYLNLASNRKLRYFWLCILAFFLIFAATYQFYPHFQERFTAVSKVGYGIIDRIITFKASIEIILKNPLFGVGVGDIQNEMSIIYDRLALSNYFYRLNSHNQYLFTTASSGLVGLLALLAMMLYPVFISLKHRKNFFIVLYLIFSLAFMTEVVLARYWGVATFSFFYSLFTSYLLDLVHKKEDEPFFQKIEAVG